jgi:uncharacterized protein YjbJ (UPF0337 family)
MAERKKGLDPTPDSNPDPITCEPGAHPVGVAGGGTGGALAGAAIGGAVGGPVGAAVGGAIGAVAGGLGGKAAAEAVNPTQEDAYWRSNYANRPYVRKGSDYDTYAPAYRYGWESASRPEFTGRSFEDVEPELQRNWSTYRGPAQTEWRDVRDASRDSFDRVRTRMRGGARDTADYAGDKAGSVWDQVQGNWNQFRGSVKEKWNELTDDDLDAMEGRRDKIVGKIQERYGEAKWREADIERELRGLGR